MVPSRLIVSVVAVVCVLVIEKVNGLDDNGESCKITEGSGITVDSCDGSKFLVCNGGRCSCPDNVNHLYTYKYEKESSRSRRSPKKGGSKGGSTLKKVAIGAGGAYVGYKVGQAVGGGGPSVSVSRNSNNNNDKNRGKKVYSCYGRVGAKCNLNYNQYNIVTVTTTTTPAPTNATTTVTPTSSTDVTTNVSSSTTESGTASPDVTSNGISTSTSSSTSASSTSTAPELPVPAAQVAEVPKFPSCVAYASCGLRSSPSSSGNSSHLVHLDSDPRIGECQCKEGYEHRKSDDICVKSASSSSTITSSMIIVFGLWIVNKIYS